MSIGFSATDCLSQEQELQAPAQLQLEQSLLGFLSQINNSPNGSSSKSRGRNQVLVATCNTRMTPTVYDQGR
ncbi:hypothetical protein PT974_09698 [Cladobotryum mycophilum]|uniref:Uncharacterized protein n=1 Tax=Cladobotryum mycophilum TaxID=491253 RepID=A0ABR0SGV7_9HYPO